MLEEGSRAAEAAAAVGAAGGESRAGEVSSRLCPGDGNRGPKVARGNDAPSQSGWRSIGDIASAIVDRVKQAPQPASEGGVSARLRRCTHRRG